MLERRFRLAAGVELVRVSAGKYALRSEFEAIELTGEGATEFAENVLASLERPVDLGTICEKLPGYSLQSVIRQIETLTRQGVVEEVAGADALRQPPFRALLDTLGLDAEKATDRLRETTVAVFGLEAHGAHLASMLAQIGIGTIRLVDPFPFEQAHLGLTPVTDPGSVGLSRQSAVAGLVSSLGANAECRTEGDLDSETVRSLVVACDLVLGCWDRAFGAASHWLNRAAMEMGVPALFGELRATSIIAGPLYLPARSACWMCYRMRAVACSNDFEQAIAFEEHLDRARHPSLATRPSLPILPQALGAFMAMEVLRVLGGLHPPTLVDNVFEYDGVSNNIENHPVLVVPDCPVCSKKKSEITCPLTS